MDQSFRNLTVAIALTSGALFSGCRSSQPEPGTQIPDRMQADWQQFKAVQSDVYADPDEPDEQAEWLLFLRDSEVRIRNNEIRIEELKGKLMELRRTLDTLYWKKIDALEKKNQILKIKVQSFDERPSLMQLPSAEKCE